MDRIDYAVQMRALLGDISECGDYGVVKEYTGKCFLALIDVLGHGAEAHKVADRAAEYLNRDHGDDLVGILNGLHERLRGTRGAVAALCSFDVSTGLLNHTGIGNITVRLFGSNPTRIVSKDGIIGYGEIRPRIQTLTMNHGDTLLMHSDGIKEHFDSLDCNDLLGEQADDIATGIMTRFGLHNDDSSCVVLKYLK